MKRIVTGGALAIAAITLAGAVYAVDHPVPSVKLILKQNIAAGTAKAVWVVKPLLPPLPAFSPIDVGAALTVTGVNDSNTILLSAGATNWITNPAWTIYKYVNKDAPGGDSVCKVVLLKDTKVLKVVCKSSIIDLDDPAQGIVKAKLTIAGDKYCTECDSALKDVGGPAGGVYVVKGCTAPAVC